MFSIIKVGTSVASTESIKIIDCEVIDKSSTADINEYSYENEKVKNSITFHKVGDSVTYTIKIKNNTDKNYTIKSISDNSTNEHIRMYTNGS